MTLRQHLARWLVERIVRAAAWMLSAQELPPMPRLPKTWAEMDPLWREELPPSQECWCLDCRELQLHRMAQLGEVLRYVDKQVPVPSYPVDTRWRQ